MCCSLASLLDHNIDEIDDIYVVHNKNASTSDSFKTIESFISSEYGIQIHEIVIDDSKFKALRLDYFFSPAIYYRLCITDYLPASLGSVLFLDPDTVITGKLDTLTKINFEIETGIYCYAVNHQFSAKYFSRLSKHCPNMDAYFNAGVIFFNLDLFRERQLNEVLIDFAKKYYHDFKMLDQDILNVHFNGKWKELPYSYNAFNLTQKTDELPKVIHYTGNRKPWNYFCDHPYRKLFWDVLKKTPFNKYLTIKRKLQTLITIMAVPIINLLRGKANDKIPG